MTSPTLVFDPEYALPNAAYRDPAVFAAETARIWHGDWVFVTTEDHVGSPGDQLPVVVGDQPVLLLRNQESELVALSNLCAHRGTLLVEQPTNAKRIQCPYHAWTYNDGGRLLAAPFTSKDDIDKAAHCLPVYRVESWHGLVFVSLNPEGDSLAERFEAVEPHVVAHRIDSLHHWSGWQETQSWACNWKLAILNAMESYHLFQVHPKTLEPYTPTRDAYYIAGSARATATGGKVEGADDYLLISLPPNFVGVFNSGSFYWQAVYPDGIDRCTIRTGGAFASAPSQRRPGRLHQVVQPHRGLLVTGLPARGQGHLRARPARRLRKLQSGRLVPAERVVADFGHYLNWRLNNIKPPTIANSAKSRGR